MADQQDNESEDAWLEQLREALADTSGPSVSEPSAPFEDVLVAPEPVPVVDPPASAQPVQSSEDTGLILDSLAQVTKALSRLSDRVDSFERAGFDEPTIDQVELDMVVTDAIRQSMARAQATGAGTTRLETEVRVLEETVAKLSKRVGELNVTALARDRLEKDVHVERLADAAEEVQGQLAAASVARKAFEAGVDKMLQHARDGDGENVAWTDVMFLTHELRSRVDDLDDQQRRAMRDLSEWQASVDDRLSSLRAELVKEVRSLRDPD